MIIIAWNEGDPWSNSSLGRGIGENKSLQSRAMMVSSSHPDSNNDPSEGAAWIGFKDLAK